MELEREKRALEEEKAAFRRERTMFMERQATEVAGVTGNTRCVHSRLRDVCRSDLLSFVTMAGTTHRAALTVGT